MKYPPEKFREISRGHVAIFFSGWIFGFFSTFFYLTSKTAVQ